MTAPLSSHSGTTAVQFVDLVVIGAGPAGANAALRASTLGLSVLLIDENRDAGGQVWRPLPSGFSIRFPRLASTETTRGDALRDAVSRAGIQRRFNCKVWNIGSNLRADLISASGSETWQPKALIVATGTTERVIPFRGWTTPGVLGLAAATILMKSQHMLPGDRTVVAGSGPLLLAVASSIIKNGGQVAAVVDLASRGEWLRLAPDLIAQPALVAEGIRWLASLRAARVPVFYRHAIRAVTPTNTGFDVELHPTDASGQPIPNGSVRHLAADGVTVGHGLVPSTDVSRLLRAEHHFVAERGGWIAKADECGRTSVAGLYVVGDAAGIAGAAAACAHGDLVGLACAFDLGKVSRESFAQQHPQALQRWRKAARFGQAMARLMAPRTGAVDAIEPDTIVCRCEDVTRADIDQAALAGARNLNQLKAWTRCGMGPCQGRTCSDVAGQILAKHVGTREAVGQFTGRAPLRPVSLAEVAGDYSYKDIPIPRAAPL